MYLKSSLSLFLPLLLSFCWSGHVSPSLRSNVSKVKSIKYRSLKVFSKCNCLCHCLCLCICLCLCRCLFVGQVMFSHDPHQFCKVGVWSGRPEGFESNTMSESVSEVGLELLGQLKMHSSEFGRSWRPNRSQQVNFWGTPENLWT